ncbi:MAG: ATP-binding protein [Chloroflexota bacterium]
MRKHYKLQIQIIFAFILIGAVTLLLFSLNLHSRILAAQKETIVKETITQLNHFDFALTELIVEARRDLMPLIGNPIVQVEDHKNFTTFLRANPDTFEYDYTEEELAIIDLFNDVKVSHEYINSVYMGRENGSFVRSHPRTIPTKYDPRLRPWYLLAKDNPGTIQYTLPYKSITNEDINIGVVSALLDDHGEVYGVVGMDITLNKLSAYLTEFEKRSSDNHLLITNSNGVILAYHQPKYLHRHFINLFNADISREILNQEQGVIEYTTWDEEELLVIFSTSQIGWKITAIRPMAKLEAQAQASTKELLLPLILSYLILIALSLIYVNQAILSPIYKLRNHIQAVTQTGNLEGHVEFSGENEIAELSYAYNAMIHSLNETQSKLEQHQHHLEELVAERTEDFRNARDEALSAVNAKNLFLANMSHEFRTPLKTIMGHSELLLSELTEDPIPETVQSLVVISKSGDLLLSLISEILDFSKLDAGEVALHPADLNLPETIQNMFQLMELTAKSKGLAFQLEVAPDIPQYIYQDQQRLQQVLLNLLSNAVKFTESGSVSLRVQRAEDQPDHLFIEVEDSGIGISQDYLDDIFTPFSQAGYNEMTSSGTGLGLYICQEIIHLMGGNIQLESKPNQGSRFYFSIPFEEITPSAAQEITPRRNIIGLAQPEQAPVLLVVDDYEDIRFLLVRLFRNIGFTVIEAANGEEALERFEDSQPDLIWLDMHMPGINGYEVARRVRETEKGKQTKIIAMTGGIYEKEIELTKAAGTDDLVPKTSSNQELLRAMQDYLDIEYLYEIEDE